MADEAFRDLLRKHGRPTELLSALRQSAGQGAAVHALPADKSAAKKRPAKRKAGKPRGAD